MVSQEIGYPSVVMTEKYAKFIIIISFQTKVIIIVAIKYCLILE